MSGNTLLTQINYAKRKLSMIPGHGKKGVGFFRFERYSFDASNYLGVVRYTVTIAPGVQGSI
jgi:hypothetical protein